MSARWIGAAACNRAAWRGLTFITAALALPLLGLLAGCTARVSSVSPPSVAAGGPAFKLTVLGSAFTSGSTVQWNGTSRSTTYVSAKELIAQINAADIAGTGSASVTVASPNSPTGTSSSGSTVASNAKAISIVAPSVDATSYQIDSVHDGAMTFSSTVNFPSSPAWQTSLGAGTPSNVAIADGNVFLTTSTASATQVLALRQSNGATAWGPKSIPVVTVGTADVAYDGGRVFVSGGDTVYAYDAGSGALDWSAAFGASSAGPPTAADGLVYVIVSGNGTLYALDQATGAVSWQQPLSAASGASAVTADGLYVTATSSGCHALDFRPATGEVIWDSAQSSGYCPLTADGTPIVANQLVYSPDAVGTSIFTAQAGTSSGTLADSLPAALTGGTGYFPQGANLDAVDLSNGTVTWTFNGDGSQMTAIPIIVNTDVVAGSAGGHLYALDSTSGQQIWTQTLSGQIEQLSAGDGLLVAVAEASHDGRGTLAAYVISSGQ